MNFGRAHEFIHYMAGQTSVVIAQKEVNCVCTEVSFSEGILDLGTKSSCLTLALDVVVDCCIVLLILSLG
jgi:hypothetical protein